jgi:hypothetical protein
MQHKHLAGIPSAAGLKLTVENDSGTADQSMSASHALSALECIAAPYSVESISVFVSTPTLSWRIIEDNVLDFWRAIN